jgi:hypothetical protein
MRSDRGWKPKGPLIVLPLPIPLAPLPPLPPLPPKELLLPPMALLVGRCRPQSLKMEKSKALPGRYCA